MGFKIAKWIVSIALIILFHGYVVGAGSALVITINDADWMNGELESAVVNWEKGYLNPIHTYENILDPKSNFEKNVSRITLYSIPVTFILFYFFLYGFLFKSKRYKEASDYGSHGSARWATRSEILRKGEVTGNPYNEIESAGVVLGYEEKWHGKGKYITIPPDSELNQNIMIYGGSGVGKDFTYIKTQIFHSMIPFQPETKKRDQAAKDRYIPREYSLFVVDPKGECYRDTAESLEAAGYEVYSFNLVNMKASHRWNSMDYIDDDIEATRFANLIISNGNDGHSGGDPFWPKAERALMTALVLFVKYETEENQQHLSNVLHIGTTYSKEEELDMLFESLPYNHPALGSYKIFKQAPAETRAGILIGFGTQLLLFANKKIAELTSQSDFRLDDMGRKKMAVFLIIPDGDTTFTPITSLFITQAFQQWWKVANENNGTCPVGIRVLGNEWANIGKIPMLAERASVMRSKGVSIQLVLQAKSQLEKIYDKDSDIILQNCDTIVFLGTNDSKTAEQMEKDLGEMTIEIQNVSKQEGSVIATNPNVSTQHQARKLRTANEIRRNSRKKNIIIQNASNPFETIKTPFIKHPMAKGFIKRDPNSVVPPKHKGMEFFQQEHYDALVGLTLYPSDVSADDVSINLNNQVPNNGLDLLEEISNDYPDSVLDQSTTSRENEVIEKETMLLDDEISNQGSIREDDTEQFHEENIITELDSEANPFQADVTDETTDTDVSDTDLTVVDTSTELAREDEVKEDETKVVEEKNKGKHDHILQYLTVNAEDSNKGSTKTSDPNEFDADEFLKQFNN